MASTLACGRLAADDDGVERRDPDVRVLVVDDQAPFRAAMATVVDCTPGFLLVGQAATGEDAVAAHAELRADLVLMDIHLPGIDGVEATRRLRAGAAPPVVLLLSTYDADELDLSGSGAAAYLPKSVLAPDRLVAAWAAAAPAAPTAEAEVDAEVGTDVERPQT